MNLEYFIEENAGKTLSDDKFLFGSIIVHTRTVHNGGVEVSIAIDSIGVFSYCYDSADVDTLTKFHKWLNDVFFPSVKKANQRLVLKALLKEKTE